MCETLPSAFLMTRVGVPIGCCLLTFLQVGLCVFHCFIVRGGGGLSSPSVLLDSIFISGQVIPPLSCLGVCFTENCDAVGCNMGRARLFPPRFGSREPQSDVVCPPSRNVILMCSMNLPCGEGFGFAPSVLLFSLFIL